MSDPVTYHELNSDNFQQRTTFFNEHKEKLTKDFFDYALFEDDATFNKNGKEFSTYPTFVELLAFILNTGRHKTNVSFHLHFE